MLVGVRVIGAREKDQARLRREGDLFQQCTVCGVWSVPEQERHGNERSREALSEVTIGGELQPQRDHSLVVRGLTDIFINETSDDGLRLLFEYAIDAEGYSRRCV